MTDSILPEGQLIFTGQQLAKILGRSDGFFAQQRFTGTGPRFQKLGPGKRSRVVYRRSDVLAWLRENMHESTSEYA
jgi:hypothetical protein